MLVDDAAPLAQMSAGAIRASLKHQFAVVVPFRQQVGKAAPIALFVDRDASIVAQAEQPAQGTGPAFPRHQAARKSCGVWSTLRFASSIAHCLPCERARWQRGRTPLGRSRCSTLP